MNSDWFANLDDWIYICIFVLVVAVLIIIQKNEMGGNHGVKNQEERNGIERGSNVTNRPLTVTVSMIFILVNTMIWITLGIVITVNAHPGLPDLPPMKGIMAFFSLAIAGFLLALLIFILKRNRIAYYLTLTAFIVTALLAIFDDVGLSDVVVLILNIIPSVLLIKDRSWYLQAKPQIESS